MLMRKYGVFVHEQLGYEAIKIGFSWPGFLFTWVWAFAKRLWGIGVGILIVAIILGAFLEASLAVDVLWSLLASTLTFVLSLYVGLYGNDWREQSMPKRGFRPLGVFLVGSPEGAIAVAIRAEKHSAVEDDARPARETYALGAPNAPEADHRPGGTPQSSAPADSAHYDRAWAEIESKDLIKATWARAFSETGGDEAKTKARYIALRVGQLRLGRTSDGSSTVPEHNSLSAATSVDAHSHETHVQPAIEQKDEFRGSGVRSESRSELDLSALHPAKRPRSPEPPHGGELGAAEIMPQTTVERRADRHRVLVTVAGIIVVLMLSLSVVGLKYADRSAVKGQRDGLGGVDKELADAVETSVSEPSVPSDAAQKKIRRTTRAGEHSADHRYHADPTGAARPQR